MSCRSHVKESNILARSLRDKTADGSQVQRTADACGCATCQRQLADTSTESISTPQAVPASVFEVLRSPGQPLASEARAFMEPRFDHDFGNVRVHTDERATQSAMALGAAAYTVGNHIALSDAATVSAPSVPQRMLLAHELAHVVQQRDATPHFANLSIGSPTSMWEREADRAAVDVVHRGGTTGHLSPAAPALSRSLFGAIVGGVAGGALGSVVGGVIGGPIGAVAGGVLGGVAGAFAGDAYSEAGRPLTTNERKQAECVFGGSINWSNVRVTESPVMGSFKNARTPLETIYFPPGTLAGGDAPYPWLIHELTHVWQTQHGISLTSKVLTAVQGGLDQSTYSYGGDAGLVAATRTNKSFRSFNTEQQGDILADFYRRLKGGGNVTPFLPFVREVRGSSPPSSC